ncbi:MAG TPA: 16S rRNA (cytidine(1402)-2'-O)-methyltransferase [Nevskiaceae bacterium]
MERGTLYVVATPIGNLADLSGRARRVLGAVDLVLAEDTRTSGALLAHFGIRQRLQALHDHNEDRIAPRFVEQLRRGAALALVSDAGTPLVSDPGYALVAAARAACVPVRAVPGPSAVVSALAVSGLPTDRFAFEGFLPSTATARRRRLEAWREETRTLVFFEAAHRMLAMADDCAAVMPDRRICVAREMTKRFEESALMQARDLPIWLQAKPHRLKGEFALVLEGCGAPPAVANEAQRVLELLLREVSPSVAARLASELTGVSRRVLYELALQRGKPSA